MALCTYFWLATTVICCFTTLFAFPMDGFATKNKCQCLRTRQSIIHSFQKIEILPPGAHCRRTEILVTRKDNVTICVDPQAPWIDKVLSKVMRKKAVRERSAVPTVA